MANTKLTIKTELDNSSAMKSLKDLESALEKAGGKTSGKANDGLTKSISGANTELSKLNEIGSQVGDGIVTSLKLIGIAGGMAATGMGFAVAKAMEFDKQMSTVRAITRGTEDDFKALSSTARELGSTTVFTATQAAQGMEFLGMAGFKTNEIISAMPGTLNLASAASIEVSRSADIMSNTLSQFGLRAEEANRVTDVLAGTITSSNTDLNQFADAMKYLGPAANAMGMSLEESSAIIGILGDVGLAGSIGTTALASSMNRMAKPTKEMNVLMEELNIEFFDANGEFQGMGKTVEMLEDRFSKLTPEQRQSALATLFGQEAFKSWSAIVEAGSGKLNTFTKELQNSTGVAQEMADIRLDNLAGDLEKLKSVWSGIVLDFGDAGTGSAREGVQALTNVLQENQREIQAVAQALPQIATGLIYAFSEGIKHAQIWWVGVRGVIDQVVDNWQIMTRRMQLGVINLVTETQARFEYLKVLTIGIFKGIAETISILFGNALRPIQEGINTLIKAANTLSFGDPIKYIDVTPVRNLSEAFQDVGTDAKAAYDKIQAGSAGIQNDILKEIQGIEETGNARRASNQEDIRRITIGKQAEEFLSRVETAQNNYNEAIDRGNKEIAESGRLTNETAAEIANQFKAVDQLKKEGLEGMSSIYRGITDEVIDLSEETIKYQRDINGVSKELLETGNIEVFGSAIAGLEEFQQGLQKTKDEGGELSVAQAKQFKEIEKAIEDAGTMVSAFALKEKLGPDLEVITGQFDLLKAEINEIPESGQAFLLLEQQVKKSNKGIDESIKQTGTVFKSTLDDFNENAKAVNLKPIVDATESTHAPIKETGTLFTSTTSTINSNIKSIDGAPAVTQINNIKSKTGELSNISSQTSTWGSHLLGNFISGIRSRLPDLTGAVSQIAGQIASVLKHTTPESGPLKDDDVWMLHFMQNLQGGIEKGTPAFMNSIDGVANGMTTGIKGAIEEIEGLNIIGTFQGITDGFLQLQEDLNSQVSQINNKVINEYIKLQDDILKTEENLIKAREENNETEIAILEAKLEGQRVLLESHRHIEIENAEQIAEIRRVAGLTDLERAIEQADKEKEVAISKHKEQEDELTRTMEEQLKILEGGNSDKKKALDSYTNILSRLPQEHRASFNMAIEEYTTLAQTVQEKMDNIVSTTQSAIAELKNQYNQITKEIEGLTNTYEKEKDELAKQVSGFINNQKRTINSLTNEMTGLRTRGQQELEKMRADYKRTVDGITGQIDRLQQSISGVDLSMKQDEQRGLENMANEIVKQQEKIGGLEIDIATKQEAGEDTSALEEKLIRERLALEQAREFEIRLSDEINEIKRINQLTDFERFFEKHLKEEEIKRNAYESEKTRMQQEVADLEMQKQQQRELFNTEYNAKFQQQQEEILNLQNKIAYEDDLMQQQHEFLTRLGLEYQEFNNDKTQQEWELFEEDQERKHEKREEEYEAIIEKLANEQEALIEQMDEQQQMQDEKLEYYQNTLNEERNALKDDIMAKLGAQNYMEKVIQGGMDDTKDHYAETLGIMTANASKSGGFIQSVFARVEAQIRETRELASRSGYSEAGLQSMIKSQQRTAATRAEEAALRQELSAINQVEKLQSRIGEMGISEPRIANNQTQKVGNSATINISGTFGQGAAEEIGDMIVQKLGLNYMI